MCNIIANNRIQLTVISVIFFAEAKKSPLITSADAGVNLNMNQNMEV